VAAPEGAELPGSPFGDLRRRGLAGLGLALLDVLTTQLAGDRLDGRGQGEPGLARGILGRVDVWLG
jgi:hypothetical protein